MYFNFLLHKMNRFHVAVRLFSNTLQRTSKCGKNISDTLGCASCATFLFLPHFDVFCDVLLNRRPATWNLFLLNRSQMTLKCDQNISNTWLMARVLLFCFYHILTSSVIYYRTDSWQQGIYFLSRCHFKRCTFSLVSY